MSMTAREIYNISVLIASEIQKLFRELSQIRCALQDVENAKEKDYDWLEEVTQEQKEVYINRDIDYAKKKAYSHVRMAITGILKESNEIASQALKILDKDIE